eukprot:TRINITY_DN11655_c0_g1_i1.p1 TRINITY_DN11655_c0_g1~~TRINITY_DN11655_c0_g1_i1.p1  ORF type:complete len:125 (-),score=30.11 TRINITY_DN11655_c0_g1_i1:37-411(-)
MMSGGGGGGGGDGAVDELDISVLHLLIYITVYLVLFVSPFLLGWFVIWKMFLSHVGFVRELLGLPRVLSPRSKLKRRTDSLPPQRLPPKRIEVKMQQQQQQNQRQQGRVRTPTPSTTVNAPVAR